MEITRHNYEEYFLLYIDNELPIADRKAVELFVQENPDLEEELFMLQQSVVLPDEKMIFSPKKNLLKDTASQGLVNENNYSAYFIQYGDDELTNQEKELVEQFVYKFPQYQAEFELIQSARLYPEQTIHFPDKDLLYRTEKDDKVVPFAWFRIAAAAVVLLVVGGLGLYIANNNGSDVTPNGGQLAETNPKKVTEQTNTVAATPAASLAANDQSAVNDQVTANDQTTANSTAPEKTKEISNYTSNISKPSHVQHTETGAAKKNQPEPVQPPTVIDYAVAKPVDVEVKSSYTRPAVNVNVSNTTSAISTPAVAVVEVKPDDMIADNSEPHGILTASVNKTPLRGFFRKVSRVVDKATSFEASEDGKGGVRIASFELALK